MPRGLSRGSPPCELWALLDGAHRRLVADLREGLAPLDLTPELMDVIYAIDRLGRVTLVELQAEMRGDGEAIAAAVRKLQLRGLLTRPCSNASSAQTPMRFTAQGRDTARRAHAVVEMLHRRAEGWLGSHRETLPVGLKRLGGMPPLTRP